MASQPLKLVMLSFLILNTVRPFDQSLFYQARFFPGEPRLAKDWLSSIALRGSGGSTTQRNDACGVRVKSDCFNRYRVHHFIVDIAQNLCRGWFVTANLPVYRIHVLERPQEEFCFSSVTNMNLTGGWTINYEDTECIDFVDVTLETGFILPTATQRAKSKGMLFRGAAALGVYDWLSIGLQADVIAFLHRANGRLWDVNFYLKADHVIRGLSLLFGYSHSDQKQTQVPWSDEEIAFWTMDTFHFSFSYDTATYECPYSPYIEFFYNHVMSGKNIIENSIFGLKIGTDF